MRRRELLAACTGSTSILAGCAIEGASLSDDTPRHPFADTTVTVRITDDSDVDNDIDRDDDVETNAREALAYWEQNAERFAGFGIDFEIVDDDPDLTIAYIDTPEPCRSVDEFSDQVLGCAPLITSRHRVPEDLTAYVVAADRPFGKIRITTKHEIGHVLGLHHDDEPFEIMSNRPEDRIPLYDVRIDIWEGVLEVQKRNAGTKLFDRGVSAWDERRCRTAEERFAAAREKFVAAGGTIEDALDKTEVFDGHPRVETVALGDLRVHLQGLLARTTTAAEFSRRMSEASAACGVGDRRRTNENLAAANDGLREFDDIEPVKLRDVAVSLGLVRGFARDETIVDIDAERLD